PKGAGSVRPLLQSLNNGNHLGMMVDQKMNDGIAAPFMGHPAMTATALVDFALRLDCPVVPARVERTGGAHFRLIVGPPMALTRIGDKKADIETNVRHMNAIIEGWVRARPEQWLWLHNRWMD
ncbi:MAG: lauroyl acyltransferase, partial [Alphaproteobacteria bacterium]|nr:lauroyl acyltransferase [Alphaproteobacteria bacterium]